MGAEAESRVCKGERELPFGFQKSSDVNAHWSLTNPEPCSECLIASFLESRLPSAPCPSYRAHKAASGQCWVREAMIPHHPK
eukprot:3658114-Amphidinium_carterae.1